LVLLSACDQVDESDIELDIGIPEPASEVVIEMTGGNYWFEVEGQRNPTITVKQGDRVRIEFESVDGFHDVVIDRFGASAQVSTGGRTSLEFVASETGTFEYYCSVGSHRERGMVGQLIVE